MRTKMPASCVEREQADAATLISYDCAQQQFQASLNIFKVVGHHPE